MNSVDEKIKKIFPHLEIKSVRANTDGLINEVFIVNEDLVFRFPKNNDYGKKLLTNETKVIELIRKYVEIPVPHFEYKSDDTVVYRFIKGNALRRKDISKLNDKEQAQIAERLAEFLKQFHNIPMSEIEQAGIAQSDVNRSREKWLKLFEDVKKDLFPLMMPHVRESIEEHFTAITSDKDFMNYTPKLINGDFVPYHIIFDRETKQINGIIDFGTAGTGDPAADFACIIYNYGESFLKKMKPVYPEISKAIDRARFWSGTLPLQWALSGFNTKNYWWNLVHLSGVRDASPIGSEF